MSVAIVGSVTNIDFNGGTPSGTFTPAGGATTKIIAAVSYARYNGAIISAISVGGNAFTKKVAAETTVSGNYVDAEIWESDVFTGSGLTVSVTSTSSWKDYGISFYCLSGAGTIVTTNTNAHAANTDLSASVSCAVGDMVIAVGSTDRYAVAYGTWANSFTSDLEQASANSLSRFATAHKVAASATETATVTAAGGSASFGAALAVAVIPAVATGPTITSTSASPANLGRVDFYGTNFPTSQTGSAACSIGGVAQTVTWDTSTHCYVAAADPGTNALNTNLDAVITDASGNASTAYVMQLGPRSGGAVVTLSGTLASASLGLEADVPLAAGNQIEYYGAVGGTIPSDVVVNVDRTYDTADAVTGFYWRPWSSGAGWGSAAFETVTHAAESSGDTGALFKTMMGSLFKTLLEAS